MTEKLSCNCGAVNATKAAYTQMTAEQKRAHILAVQNCRTCAYDRKHK